MKPSKLTVYEEGVVEIKNIQPKERKIVRLDKNLVTIKGMTKRLKNWCLIFGVPYQKMYNKIVKRKMDPEQAFNEALNIK